MKSILSKIFKKKLYDASITVEATFSFVIVMFIMFLMLGPLFSIKTTTDILLKLDEITNNRCAYETINYKATSSNIYRKISSRVPIEKFDLSKALDVVSYGLFFYDINKMYGEDKREYRLVRFIFDYSDPVYEKETGIVRYDYDVDFKLPYNILHTNGFSERFVSSKRAFIGSDGNRFASLFDTGEYVYVADNHIYSKRYHTHLSCHYLNKNTFSFRYDELSTQRNDAGGKYTKCPYCFRGIKITNSTECFGTKYGDRFHYRSDCNLMTANITKIKIEEIEIRGLTICPVCEKKGDNE